MNPTARPSPIPLRAPCAPHAPCAPRAALRAAVAAAALALASVRGGPADAGCLAPADSQIDGAGVLGPFAGNDEGTLLYAVDPPGTSAPRLVRREIDSLPETVAVVGESNEFDAGLGNEVWTAFHGGSVNRRGDFTLIASTTGEDDPQTPTNEGLARRGVYVRRGNTDYRLGRFGEPSPIFDLFGGRVPWGAFFDAVPLARADIEPLRAVFSGQVGAPDGRIGIFTWTEGDAEPAPLVLVGDPSPSGGTFQAIGRLRANEAGDLVFLGVTAVSQSAASVPGLFLFDRNGGRARLVRFGTSGDDAPGGGTLSLLGDFDVDGDGGVVFASALTGGGAPSGLFRAPAPTYVRERIAVEGDPTPLGGTFESFLSATVRVDEDGGAVVLAPVSQDIGGAALFTLPAGGGETQPLVAVRGARAAASLGAGRVAYQTDETTRRVLPADGSDEGPKDFRVALVDLKNSVPLRRDGITFSGRFRLPAWGGGAGEAPPAVFSTTGVTREIPGGRYAGDELTKVAEVRVLVSDAPGQEFVFGFSGTDADPKGTLSINGLSGTVTRLKLGRTRDQAVWTFQAVLGKGSFSADLAKGTFDLRLSQGNVLPSFDATSFRVAFTLRTDDDVAASRTGDDAFFHRAIRLAADQPNFGTGRRVRSRGERLPGGTFFVDALRVDRTLRVVKGVAAPTVTSDRISVSGTLRTCPGATPPATPTLGADVTVGSFALPGISMRRIGRRGSKYTASSAKGAKPSWRVDLDVVKGTFRLAAAGVPPLPQCVDADFSPSPAVNGADVPVGGMSVPVAVRFARVYEAADDIAVVRRPGGRVFER